MSDLFDKSGGFRRLHSFTLFLNFYRKNRIFLSGYLIRLTREYTDGGMDSRSELLRNQTKATGLFPVISSIEIFLSAQMFAPPSVYPRVRRA